MPKTKIEEQNIKIKPKLEEKTKEVKEPKEKEVKEPKEKEVKEQKKEQDELEDTKQNKGKVDFDIYDFYKNYDPSKNKFDPILTLYEFTSCLGIRETQLSEGASPLVDVPEGMESVEDIALLEMKQGKCPLIICREGKEYWRVCDLVNPYVM